MEGGWRELEALDAALAADDIDEAEWYRRRQAMIVPAYLAADNPRAQSGQSGDEAGWEDARGLVVEAIDRDGTFLDVGCASGHLMETTRQWAAERGFDIEPYGLDLSPELADLAGSRLPRWAGRIWVGNALDWEPPRRFDFVHLQELTYVPEPRRRQLVEHLLRDVCEPDGRLIVGPVERARRRMGDRAPRRVVGLRDRGSSRASEEQRGHATRVLARRRPNRVSRAAYGRERTVHRLPPSVLRLTVPSWRAA